MNRSRSTFGYLYNRPDRPGWYVRFRINGKQVIKYAGANRRTAEAFVARLRRLHEEETLLGKKAIPAATLAEVERGFLRHLSARQSASSASTNRQRFERLRAELGTTPLRDVDRAMVEDILTRLRVENGLSAGTVNRYASLLSTVFKYAIDRGYARDNPVRGVRREREEQRAVPFIGEDDVAKLVAAAQNPELAALIRVLSDTGLRRSEALALQWRDVDLRRAVLVVRKSKTREPREVPLTGACVAALREQAARVEVLPQHGQGPVWPALAALRPDGVSKRFKGVAKRAGMPGLRLHDMRHGFACRLREAGVPIQTIAALAGHKSLTTTLRYSRHMAGSSLRNAIDALELNGSESPHGIPSQTEQAQRFTPPGSSPPVGAAGPG